MTIMAIDPGKNGGLATGMTGKISVIAMPSTEKELGDYFLLFKRECSTGVVYMEEVGGFHRGKEERQPGSAMFNFGRGVGFILGCCAALEIPVKMLTPAEWQKPLGLHAARGKALKPEDKKRAMKEEAIRLYPELAAKRNAITLKTCDALLILEVARRMEIPRGERKWRG